MMTLWISLAVFGAVVALSGWAYCVNFPEHRSLSGFLVNWLETIILFGLSGIPTWTFLAAKYLLMTPEGFWQQLIAFCCVLVLVSLQVVFLLLFFLGLCKTWENPG